MPVCFLFDNGSLRAASTRSLRAIGDALRQAIPGPVETVSLLHSSVVPAAELDGVKARLLEPALDAYWASGGREAVLLPLFFGPSAALTEYLPARLGVLRAKWPQGQARLARPLVDPSDAEDLRMVKALADGVRTTMARNALTRPPVLLVDHGSPQRGVTAVREFLGARLRVELAAEVVAVGTCSMERREEDEYDFNEPLLERALKHAPFDRGDVVVALQFLSPGRHAGPEGDIARICETARRELPELRPHLTAPIGPHPQLIALLADRYREAVKPDSSAR